MLPYLDIPFQHASPDVLQRMKRPAAQEKTLERIARWREICPDLTIALDLHRRLSRRDRRRFRNAARLARRGRARSRRLLPLRAGRRRRCERSRGAGAEEVKEERWHRFMRTSRRSRHDASSARSAPASRSSSTRSTRGTASCRTGSERRGEGPQPGDAPEIDGAVYVKSRRPLRVGEIATVKIERADEYDLHGTAVGSEARITSA